MTDFVCATCDSTFTLPQHVLDKYPGWKPKQCLACRDADNKGSSAKKTPAKPTTKAKSGGRGSNPTTGVFTDGGASPNPGPGGWGVVHVQDNEVVGEMHGADPDTTNNRMELTALIQAAHLVPEGTGATIYSDSSLAINTITQWAAGWKQRGWKRKTGPVENLDLVKEAYELFRVRPDLELVWIKGHDTSEWNEYADGLANRWREP